MASVKQSANTRVFKGTLAALLADTRVWLSNHLITPTDYPMLQLRGNDVNTFAELIAEVLFSQTAITAHAGGGQGSAYQLTRQYNVVATVSTALDSVKLPTARLGLQVIVKNTSAVNLAVYGKTGGVIDGGAANAVYVIPPKSTVIFTGVSATAWETNKKPVVIQTLSGAGAVDITSEITHLVTTGANALTLAATGVAEGMRKFIRMKTDGGDGTLTVTGVVPAGTIVFTAVGDFAELLFTDGAWHKIVVSVTA